MLHLPDNIIIIVVVIIVGFIIILERIHALISELS
jgi:hypothetical protein